MNSATMNQYATLKRSYKYYYKDPNCSKKLKTHNSAVNQLQQNYEKQIIVS